MLVLVDCFGRKVRLTEERLAHILEHPEMKGLAEEVERVASAAGSRAVFANG